MLKEREMLEKGMQVFKECLLKIPGVKIETMEPIVSGNAPDYRICVRGNQVDQIININVKPLGTPKSTREAVNLLVVNRKIEPSSYDVFVAPFISSVSALICKEAGVGYLDLSGNCHIAFQGVFISRENMPNQYPFKTSLSSLYSPKSERILRVLLSFPYRPWKTKELAKEAQVSLGMITHVRKKLDGEEWIKTSSGGFFLSQPDELLMAWSKNYSWRQNKMSDFYTLKSLSDIETEIAKTCDDNDIPYALTGFSASNHLAPMVRGQRVMVYIDHDIDILADQLDLKPVDSGANVSLIQPYDSGVLWNAQYIDDLQIATPIQVFLDLDKSRGRGKEAANFLYKEVIKKSWVQQKSSMITSL